MAEYIEREAVCSDCKNKKVCVDKSVCPVGRAPAADVEVVKHGRWVWKDFHGDGSLTLCCSECLGTDGARETAKYCSECGTKMDLEG